MAEQRNPCYKLKRCEIQNLSETTGEKFGEIRDNFS